MSTAALLKPSAIEERKFGWRKQLTQKTARCETHSCFAVCRRVVPSLLTSHNEFIKRCVTTWSINWTTIEPSVVTQDFMHIKTSLSISRRCSLLSLSFDIWEMMSLRWFSAKPKNWPNSENRELLEKKNSEKSSQNITCVSINVYKL